MLIGYITPLRTLENLDFDHLPDRRQAVAQRRHGYHQEFFDITPQQAILIVGHVGSIAADLKTVGADTLFSCQSGGLQFLGVKDKGAIETGASLAVATVGAAAAIAASPVYAIRREMHATRTHAAINSGGDSDFDYEEPYRAPSLFGRIKNVGRRIGGVLPSAVMKGAHAGARGKVAVQISQALGDAGQPRSASVAWVINWMRGKFDGL